MSAAQREHLTRRVFERIAAPAAPPVTPPAASCGVAAKSVRSPVVMARLRVPRVVVVAIATAAVVAIVLAVALVASIASAQSRPADVGAMDVSADADAGTGGARRMSEQIGRGPRRARHPGLTPQQQRPAPVRALDEPSVTAVAPAPIIARRPASAIHVHPSLPARSAPISTRRAKPRMSPSPSTLELLGAGGTLLVILVLLGWVLARRSKRALVTAELPAIGEPPIGPLPIDESAAAESRLGGRSSLEDRSLALTFANGLRAIVVADGLGGHPGGARAASIATEIARARLEDLRDIARPTAELALDVVRGIFPRVGEALHAEDAELGLARHGVDGLRTTLIVGLRIGHQLVAGAIGDGGLFVVGLDARPTRVIEPHRGEASNIVTASLGPTTEGEPVFRVMPIGDDDIIVAGSDGLVDRVNDTFYPKVRAVLAEHARPGDAVRFILDALLAGDDARATFDDNVSIAVIAPEPAA